MSTRILSGFRLLKRVGFAVLLLGRSGFVWDPTWTNFVGNVSFEFPTAATAAGSPQM